MQLDPLLTTSALTHHSDINSCTSDSDLGGRVD